MRAIGVLVFLAPALAAAATRTVGPGKTYATPCAAIAAAQPGDVIEVDAGSYNGDHCSWSTDNLVIRGVGGRAKIDGGKNAANISGDKGIFVIGATNATIENFELSGAVASPASQNGAGIRHQGTNLTVRNCYFHDNEDGILGSPITNGTGEILIENSEFAQNGFGDGYTHNMYLNHYAKFTLRFSYTHAAKVGHLVKSRALENYIYYNRITDEVGTTASYEIDLPNAGLSYIIGNLIEQSNTSQNPAIISYGEESNGMNPDGHLWVINNTIVNSRSAGGTFVVDASTTFAAIMNNALLGPGTVTSQSTATLTTNYTGTVASALLVDPANYDYSLQSGSPCVDVGSDVTKNTPTSIYVHPLSSNSRTSIGVIDIGAFELGGSPPPDAGTDSGISDSGTDANTLPDVWTSPNGEQDGVPLPEGGCSCRTSPHDVRGEVGMLALAVLALRRQRKRTT